MDVGPEACRVTSFVTANRSNAPKHCMTSSAFLELKSGDTSLPLSGLRGTYA